MKVIHKIINMVESFSKKLIRFKEKENLTQREMSQLLGISERMYNYYEKGEYDGNPKKVEKYLQKLSGNENIVYEPPGKYAAKDDSNMVPVYDIEFTAGFVEQIRDKQPEILTYTNMPEVQGCDYIIRAKGESMADYINNMDWIGIKAIQDKEVIAYGNAYAIVTKDLQLIKYIRKGSKGNYLLSSRNKDYDDFEIPIAKVLDLFIIKTVLKIKTLI